MKGIRKHFVVDLVPPLEGDEPSMGMVGGLVDAFDVAWGPHTPKV
jgi:hypothetical protein